ncbi:MAG: hypothetical protein K6F84_04375 [Lachnospiraceae bacterium]|nr:hypothetical protein [Lachnospiraceae bacterium]
MKFISKMKPVVLFAMMTILISACAQDENDTVTELEGESIIEPIVESIAEEEENIAVYSENEFVTYESISDLFKGTDLNWNESEAYQNAVSAYETCIGLDSFGDEEGKVLKHDMARFKVAYIDEDDIPELAICFGTLRGCGIHIFKYDPELNETRWIGEYGYDGFCYYTEKKNRIGASYGGMGLFHYYVSKIEDYKPVLIDVTCYDGNGFQWGPEAGEYYFHKPSLPDLTGAKLEDGSEPDYYEDFEREWMISAEECARLDDEDMCTAGIQSTQFHYDEMKPAKFKDGGKTFAWALF